MDKIRVGIPRALHYYYYGVLWKSFLEELGCEVIISPTTTKEIVDSGIRIANDEMCLSLKIYLGHVSYLESKCDYVLVPRIDNYGVYEQTCTNFLGLYDLIQNLFDVPLLTYNVDEAHRHDELNGFLELGKSLGKGKEQSKIAYFHSLEKLEREKKKAFLKINQKFNTTNIKLLVVSHPYNFEDAYVGGMIKKLLQEMQVEWIDGTDLIGRKSREEGVKISHDLYWKYNKEMVGTIALCKDKIDGVLFLTTFPCGPDSLVNELLFRKMNIPHLSLILDDESGSAGIETRLESFIDILEQRKLAAR